MEERPEATWARVDALGRTIQYRSQMAQDRFVAGCLAQKHGGTFVDIGAGDPEDISNTVALERSFGWAGLLCDIEHFDALLKRRDPKNIVLRDAIQPSREEWGAHFQQLVDCDDFIDFLSLDLEPPDLTVEVLLNLPLNDYKFRIACVEHDAYRGGLGDLRRDLIRSYMGWHRYQIVARVGPNGCGAAEDWFVHEDAGIDATSTLKALGVFTA